MAANKIPLLFKLKHRAIVFLVVLALGLAVTAEAYALVSGQLLFARRYDGIKHKNDTAVSVDIGPRNTVYVTGSSGKAYATIKYRKTGAVKWIRRYRGPNKKQDNQAVVVKVDRRGNAYVAGSSPGRGTGYDFATIKYSPGGRRKWVRRFNARANGNDFATDLAIGKTGIYVTGQSDNLHGKHDFLVIKYAFNGRKRWVRRYKSRGDDAPAKLALDAHDNVYVTGPGNNDYLTVKYNRHGRRRWAKRYNGSANDADTPVGIAVDKAGNAYITGGATNSSTGLDYTTIKYNTRGDRQWVRTYDGPVHADDMAAALEVDADGDVIVFGTGMNISPGGLGTRPKTSFAVFSSPSIQSRNYTYVPSPQASSALQLRLWAGSSNFDRPSEFSSPSNKALNLALQANEDIADYVTIKYDAAGNQQWLQRYAPFDIGTAMAVDKKGNVFITGVDFGNPAFYWAYGTVKYDSTGKRLWSRIHKKRSGVMNFALDIAVDRRGAAYVTGTGARSFNNSDYLTVKYAR